MLDRFLEKLRQVASYFRHTRTPVSLSLDSLRMKRRGFVAVSKTGQKLRINPGVGESFTFYENLVRRDYLEGVALKTGSTVLDVGANIGAFSVLAASMVGPTGRVLDFEPMPETFERLRANVALNGLENVECRCAAIDGKEGMLTMQTSRKSALASAYMGAGDETHEGLRDVPCLTLEGVLTEYGIDRVDLLKVDCEGSEYQIFETLTPAVAARIDRIAMEVHPVSGRTHEKLRDDLESLGFNVECGYTWFAARKL